MTVVPSKFQQAIYGRADLKRNLLIQARAGSGKTTTIVQLVKHIDRALSIMFVAFNKRIVGELKSRITAPNCQVVTTHSAGFALVRAALPRVRVADDKVREIAVGVLEDAGRANIGRYEIAEVNAICRVVGLAKATLADREQIGEIAWEFGDEKFKPELLADLAWKALRASNEDANTIDFDDMIYLPYARGLRARRPVDVVIVDEVQDLSLCQLDLIRRLIKPDTGRIVAVGDSSQAIYQFRGADSNSMGRIRDEFDCEVLPLSYCYRCPTTVIERLKTWCPDIEAPPGAPVGSVEPATTERMEAEAKPGDYSVSRKNAPLLGLCFGFMKRGIPAAVAGKDLAKGLVAMIDKAKQPDVARLVQWLDAFRMREMKRLEKAKNAESKLDAMHDRLDCLLVLTEGEETIAGLKAKITGMFTDTTSADGSPLPVANRLILSTVHKVKGLEAKRVWKLENTFAGFRKMTPAQSQELANLHYVAESRAQETLYLVRDPKV